MSLTQNDVIKFKTVDCNENRIITDIIASRFATWIGEPFLDVGCGLGDITASVLPDKRGLLLDQLNYASTDIPKIHRRIIGDFFDYQPSLREEFPTLLFIHVLQYLDADINRLNEKVLKIDPEKILVVLNRNVGDFGSLIFSASDLIPESNPEVELPGFPRGFNLMEEIDFEANLVCRDWNAFCGQVAYLLDVEHSDRNLKVIQQAARSILKSPEIRIPQTIRAFERTK